MKTPVVYEHTDRLGQPIQVGNYVAFTSYHYRGVWVGTITKLTAKRVKMTFTNSYEHNGERKYYTCRHIAHPQDCLILSETLPQHLTLATLQKKI